jgi:hypothetical protein
MRWGGETGTKKGDCFCLAKYGVHWGLLVRDL